MDDGKIWWIIPIWDFFPSIIQGYQRLGPGQCDLVSLWKVPKGSQRFPGSLSYWKAWNGHGDVWFILSDPIPRFFLFEIARSQRLRSSANFAGEVNSYVWHSYPDMQTSMAGNATLVTEKMISRELENLKSLIVRENLNRKPCFFTCVCHPLGFSSYMIHHDSLPMYWNS